MSNPNGMFKPVQVLLKSRQMLYLEMHTFKDGIATFGAKTDYDFYFVRNTANKGNFITKIKGQDGKIERVDISKMEFIPNGMFAEIKKLVAKDGEERTEVTHSCDYHTQRPHMSKVQTNEFKYPCVQSVNVKSEPCCFWYSSTDKNGHFGIPKVVFVRLGRGVMVDRNGDYGLCEDCSGIVDEPSNLDRIHKAMKSPRFVELMKFANVGGQNGNIYDRKVIALFRKDFWVDFLK
jgi:hypothetical protein